MESVEELMEMWGNLSEEAIVSLSKRYNRPLDI